MEVQRQPNPAMQQHLAEGRRVLALPVEVSGLRWHPFGVYTLPLAKRSEAGGTTWSRRLHLWHPEAEPVGEHSAYGVHTHSGQARSHVLAGALHHHLYAFRPDPEGIWDTGVVGGERSRADLVAHTWAETVAGHRHILPAHHAHAVSKPDGWAISLFEQEDTTGPSRFTTWRRTDGPEIPLLRRGPVSVVEVQREALHILDALVMA